MAEFELKDVGTVLAVADFAASLEFYTKNLGLEPVMMFDDPPFAILGRGSFRLCLAEEGYPADDVPGVLMQSLPDPQNPPVRLVLWVSDCVATYESLLAEGVSFLGPPTFPPWGGSRCFAVDPDGYQVEIEQLPDEA
jgi:catechol 2,3-dioxygenase-like lactoylglutathione lyase family enzyme